jgi:hypothetical protein
MERPRPKVLGETMSCMMLEISCLPVQSRVGLRRAGFRRNRRWEGAEELLLRRLEVAW